MTEEEFCKVCMAPEVQAAFDFLELPIERPAVAARFYEVLNAEMADSVPLRDVIERTSTLMQEGEQITRNGTLLLMECRALRRCLWRLEKSAFNQEPPMGRTTTGY